MAWCVRHPVHIHNGLIAASGRIGSNSLILDLPLILDCINCQFPYFSIIMLGFGFLLGLVPLRLVSLGLAAD
jgi:hypothetical protein